MNISQSMRISATALTAERLRMDVISNNIANSQTTRTDEGGAFQRKQVVLAANESRSAPVDRFRRTQDLNQGHQLAGVRVQQIIVNQEGMVRTYQPDHPDADEEGFVEYPNVDITTEMVDMMAASKAYRANISAIQTSKSMAQAALQIGRGG